MKNFLQAFLIFFLLLVVTLLIKSQFDKPFSPSDAVHDSVLGILVLGSSLYALNELRSINNTTPFNKRNSDES